MPWLSNLAKEMPAFVDEEEDRVQARGRQRFKDDDDDGDDDEEGGGGGGAVARVSQETRRAVQRRRLEILLPPVTRIGEAGTSSQAPSQIQVPMQLKDTQIRAVQVSIQWLQAQVVQKQSQIVVQQRQIDQLQIERDIALEWQGLVEPLAESLDKEATLAPLRDFERDLVLGQRGRVL